MNFIKQVKFELVNLLKTKFILILGILVLLAGIAFPLINYGFEQYYADQEDGWTYSWYSDGEGESIIIDGVEITSDNPFYWDLNYYGEECLFYLTDMWGENGFVYGEELASEIYDNVAMLAKEITSYEDYRYDFGWQITSVVAELFVLEAEPEDKEEFINVVNSITYVDKIEEYLDMTEEQKASEIESRKEFLEDAEEAIVGENFDKYADCMIELLYAEIESYENTIAMLEASIIENPDLEESSGAEILQVQTQIAVTLDSTIPTWEYRKENQLLPNSEDWRNNALSSIESATYRITNYSNVVSEEDFKEDYWLEQQYGDYDTYVEAMAREVVEAQEDILIAQNSLDADKPDMQFVYEGARNLVNSNLFYSIIVSFLAILIGGYLVANEFQSGTIRLLMIRPRTRAQVYGAKFIAGLIYCYAVYLGGMFLNIIVNGIISGFGDYAFPNYSASGPINFWVMIMGRILCCSLTIIFSYSVAYGVSAVIRNAAIAIALPSAAIFGGMIGTSIVCYTQYADFLAYTPLPYLNWTSFYSEYGVIPTLIDKGVNISTTIGILMLLGLSILCYIVGYIFFKRNDITN